MRDLGVASIGHRRRLLDGIAALGEGQLAEEKLRGMALRWGDSSAVDARRLRAGDTGPRARLEPDLDEIEPIVAEEHFIIDEEGWHAEYAACHRALAVGGKPLLHLGRLRHLPQFIRERAAGGELRPSRCTRPIIRAGPNRAEQGVVYPLENAQALATNSGARKHVNPTFSLQSFW